VRRHPHDVEHAVRGQATEPADAIGGEPGQGQLRDLVTDPVVQVPAQARAGPEPGQRRRVVHRRIADPQHRERDHPRPGPSRFAAEQLPQGRDQQDERRPLQQRRDGEQAQ
jgi:hypothetical protein